MTSVPDPYREWDAAYVLGSLSPSERHEYEQHLSICRSCSADVSELAGISGVLRAVPDQQAMALLADDEVGGEVPPGPARIPPMPPNLLPSFVRAAKRARTRARARTAAWTAGGLTAAAAAIVVIALAVGLIGSPSGNGHHLTMEQTTPGPITAVATLTEQPWGTTIQLECTYADTGGDVTHQPWHYALYVVDRSGTETEQATWLAGAGSTVTPTGTTSLSLAEIQRIEIRWVETDRVVLEATPGF